MKRRRRRRGWGFLEIILLFLTVLVLLALLTITLAILYPNSARQASNELGQNIRPIVKDISNANIYKRARDGFNYRIKPFFQSLIGMFSKSRRPPEVEKKPSLEEAAKIDFTKCVDCHGYLYATMVTSRVISAHLIHKAEGISCFVCHQDATHPKPQRIAESTCLRCHQKVKSDKKCSFCHSPGSLLALVPKEKKVKFFEVSTVKTKDLRPPEFGDPIEGLKGNPGVACAQCHEVPTFCNRCHLVFHKQLPDWVPTHGGKLLGGTYVMNTCWACHNANWCAATCHANAPNRQRRSSIWPLPYLPLGD